MAGKGTDASKPAEISLPGEKVITVRPGTKINIILRSKYQIKGKFSGLVEIPAEKYAEVYARSRDQNREKILLPTLGQTVIITTDKGNEYECEFLGFDLEALALRGKKFSKSEDVNIGRIIKIVGYKGAIFEVEAIRKLMSEGKIPFLSAIVIKNKGGETQVRVEDVYQIQVKVKKNAWLWGALGGFGFDLMWIILYQEDWH
jgi:hypothetical protein